MYQFFITFMLFATLSVLSACGSEGTAGSSLIAFDHENLNNAVGNLEYNPELPTGLPFEPEQVDASVGPSGDLGVLIVDEEAGHLNITIINGKMGEVKGGETEEVELSDGQTVLVGDGSVYWEKDGISYAISYMPLEEESSATLDQEALLEIVEHFE